MTTLSPFAPPLNLNDMKGFFDTAGPHCAESTVLPFQVAETLWINHAGIVFPCASLRSPVSISWFIKTLTSVESPTRLARIFIGSAMSTSATAERDLDFLGRHVILAVSLDERVDVGSLVHLHPRRNGWIGARWDVEVRGEHVRILLDEYRDRLGPRNVAGYAYRHDRAVLRNVRRLKKHDVPALRGLPASQRLHGLRHVVGLEGRLVPRRRLCICRTGPDPAGGRKQRQKAGAGPEKLPSRAIHCRSPTFQKHYFTLPRRPVRRSERVRYAAQ